MLPLGVKITRLFLGQLWCISCLVLRPRDLDLTSWADVTIRAVISVDRLILTRNPSCLVGHCKYCTIFELFDVEYRDLKIWVRVIRGHWRCHQVIMIIIIIIQLPMFMSSRQNHCESSPGSLGECRTAPSDRRPSDQAKRLGLLVHL